MAKKLLSEAQVRRFAKLANLSPINEMYHKRDEEEMEEAMHSKRDEDEKMEERAYMKRDEKEELQEITPVGPAHNSAGGKRDDEEKMEEAEEPEMDMPEEPEMEMGGMGDEEMELTDEEAQAIIDLGKKLEAAMGEGGMEEPEMDMPGDAPDMDDAGKDMGEEEIMEALSDITYVPEQKEIVEEVARRVAKRLLEAKRAKTKLDQALAKK